MADNFTPEPLNRAALDYAVSVEDVKRGVSDIVNRQNWINEQLSQYTNTGGADLSALQTQVDTLSAQVTTLSGQISDIEFDITNLENQLTDLQDYQLVSVSSTANSTLGPNRFLGAAVTMGAGAGVYTYDLVLTGSLGGEVKMLVTTPASAGRVLNIRNATVGGTILQTITSTAVARTYSLIFIHNGTTFVKHLLTTL